MTKILVIAEQEGGTLKSYSKELASKAFELAEGRGEVAAIAFGAGAEAAVKSLGAFGVASAFAAEQDDFKDYLGEVYSQAALQAVETFKPQIILASATTIGKDLLPRLAQRLKSGLATDCTELSMANGKLKCRRPIFAGKALIDVNFQSPIQLATARPNSFPTKEAAAGKQASVQKMAVTLSPVRTKIKETKVAEKGMTDLTEAEVIVAGGRALGSGENFKVIQELATVLGATVGASRAAVDAGYISHDHQVGQTGKTVNPKLYIACGISGAIQHLAGMRTAKVIVSINKDPEAPIFSKSDYGLVGDLFQLLPILTKKFKELLGK